MLRTCYLCATMKSKNPIGIRFDLEKAEFVMTKEKLKSNQQLVDFLLNKYWWEHKVPVPTYKESPPIHLKEDPRNGSQEQRQLAKQPIVERTVAQWVLWKQEIEHPDEYKKYISALMASNLSSKQKEQLK